MIIRSCNYMYMAVSHKDWELQNSGTCLAEINSWLACDVIIL